MYVFLINPDNYYKLHNKHRHLNIDLYENYE